MVLQKRNTRRGRRFQLAAVYDSMDPPDIINDLLTNATQIPPSYIDLAAWKAETDAFLGRLYSGKVMQPTPVKNLIQEIIQDAGLTFFVDVENANIVLRVLRQEIPVAPINDDFVVAGSLKSKKLYDKRVSESWIYYGKKNPLEAQSEKKNYKTIYAGITTNPVVALENNPPAIRDMASRWITVFNTAAAQDVVGRTIARYETAPNEISFKTPNRFPIVAWRLFEFSAQEYFKPAGRYSSTYKPSDNANRQLYGGLFCTR